MHQRNYRIISVAPCLTDGSQFKVTALLSNDVSQLMPYLNAALRFCAYEPFLSTLTFKCKGSPVVLHPDRVVVGQLREVDSAEDILNTVVAFIDHIHNHKKNLKPEYTTKELPQPKEVYALLPQTNCGDCGEATCIAFTVKLIKGEKRVEECPHLASEYAGKIYRILEDMDDSETLLGRL